MLFADKSFIADMTAKMMLEVKAVHFSEGKPFIFTSGWASPVYIDCRKLISYPRVRSTLIDFATATIVREAGFEQFDTVASRSKVNFCKALRDAGAIVEYVLVMFYYDIFPESKKILADINVRLMHLATWWDVLRVVKQGGYFDPGVIDEVERFLNAPAKWSAEHGGVSAFPES